MTIPFYIEQPITHQQIKVPQEIVYYCDKYTIDANRDDLRYLDCVLMHMEYYGTSKELMKKFREESKYSISPIFD